MGAVSSPDFLNLFKTVFANGVNDIVPTDQMIGKDIPFTQKQRVGQNYVESVSLTAETGITFSDSNSAFSLASARAGTVAQASVIPYVSVLPSILPWSSMSRSSAGDAVAFYDANRWIVKNNLKSHSKFQEIIRIHGQSDYLLGYVSYATANYRGVDFTDGTGTLNGVAFVNGVSASTKSILLAPGYFASGIYVGMEGVEILQVDALGIIQAAGSLVSVNSQYGYITVDFVPVAATTTTSSRIAFRGMEDAQTYPGIVKILTSTGNLFGINTARYSLWKGSQFDFQQYGFSLTGLNQAIANMVNAGGDPGNLTCYVNPRSWATLTSDAAGLRFFDQSYKPKEMQNGFESIKFYAQNGVVEVKPHRMVLEGQSICLALDTWSRSGSSEVSFTIPGQSQPIIFNMESQAGMCFRSYSDQYIFNHAPAQNLYMSGINDEAASFSY